MSFNEKLALFYIVIRITLWLLARYPQTRISKLAFSYYGPIPTAGEYKSHYYLRWAGYAIGWFSQILLILAIGVLVDAQFSLSTRYETSFLVFLFASTILGGIALLGCALAFLAALKAKFIGPNPTFMGTHEIHPGS